MTGPRWQRRRYRWWTSGCGARSPSSTSYASTISAASSPTGRSRRATGDAGGRALVSRPGRRAVRGRARRAGRAAARPPRTSARSLPRSSARARRSASPAWSVAPVRVRRRRAQRVRRRRLADRRPTPGPTITRRSRSGGASSTPSVAPACAAALRERGIRWQGDARAHTALIRLAFSSPAGARDDPGRGPCWAWAPRALKHPRARRRQLGLPSARRPAHSGRSRGRCGPRTEEAGRGVLSARFARPWGGYRTRMTPTRLTGIARLRRLRGVTALLHDDVALTPVHDRLDRGKLMARREQKVARMGPYGLILGDRQLDQHVAAQRRAIRTRTPPARSVS